MTPDFKDLMAKAKAASLEERDWYAATDKGLVEQCGVRDAAFIAAASPDTIIALGEELERLREALEVIAGRKPWRGQSTPYTEIARTALGAET